MPGKALCDTLWRARGQWCNAAGCSEWCVHLAQDPGPLPEVCSEPSAMAMQLKPCATATHVARVHVMLSMCLSLLQAGRRPCTVDASLLR